MLRAIVTAECILFKQQRQRLFMGGGYNPKLIKGNTKNRSSILNG